VNKFGIDLPRAHKRLEILYEEVKKLSNTNDIIVDVGTDHGYLAALLAKTQVGEKIIATDISVPSLRKAEVLAKKNNLNIDCRVGDGLSVAPDATLAIMCGIGGNEIINILENSGFCDKMVLQPVPTEHDLREYLLKNNYHIQKDYVIFDEGKFYFIFVVDGKGKNSYSKKDRLFGKTNVNNITNDFQEYLKNQINKLSFLENFDITGLSKQSKNDIIGKQKYLQLCRELLKRG